MAMIKCPECGKDISDKAAACPHCGNPMSSAVIEKPKQIDKEKDEIERYLALARRAKEENNYENATRYYDLVLQKKPLSWEASFYQVYFKAMGCKIIQISGAAISIANCLDNVLYLIKDYEKPNTHKAAATEVFTRCVIAATMLSNAGINHYNKFPTADGAFGECADRVVSAGKIYESFVNAMKKNFSQEQDIKSTAAEAYAKYIYNNSRFYNRDWGNKKIAEMEAIIKETKPSYIASTIPGSSPSTSGGCYVATAVYGSYDCPEVWTLRRYRDNKLAKTKLGRIFIRCYYATSPWVVKHFGEKEGFTRLFKGRLDKMVNRLEKEGFESTPYRDKEW